MLRQFLKHLNTELLHDWHFHFWVYKQHKWKQGLEQTLCTQFTAAYSQQPKMKEAKSPSLDEWINEVCSIHTMKYYSALERQKANTSYNTDEPQGRYANEMSQPQKELWKEFWQWMVVKAAQIYLMPQSVPLRINGEGGKFYYVFLSPTQNHHMTPGPIPEHIEDNNIYSTGMRGAIVSNYTLEWHP